MDEDSEFDKVVGDIEARPGAAERIAGDVAEMNEVLVLENRVRQLEQRLLELVAENVDLAAENARLRGSSVLSPPDQVLTPDVMQDLFRCWDRYENSRTPVDAAFMLVAFYDSWMAFRRALVTAGVLPTQGH